MSPHVIVIGAGIVGLSTACSLARAGVRVSVLERGAPGRESSWAGAGILSSLLPWDYPDAVHRLVEEGRRLWPIWADDILRHTGIDPEYRVSGMLALAVPAADRALEWCRVQGWPGHAGQEIPSWVQSAVSPELLACDERSAAHVWLPEVAQLRNPRLVRGMASLAETLGVRIRAEQARISWRLRNDRISHVIAGQEELACTHVVICAGAWSAEVLGELGVSVPIKPIRGQILLFRDAPGRLPCIVYRQGNYLVPRADGHILAGSTLEDVGFDKATTGAAYAELRRFAWETLSWLRGIEPIRHWSGLRPGSDGNVPIIARHPAIGNLYLNGGHYRYGVTMAPASADRLTRLLREREAGNGMSDYAWRSH